MSKSFPRRACIGVLAGGISSLMLVATLGNNLLAVLLGVLVGVIYACAYRSARGAYADQISVRQVDGAS